MSRKPVARLGDSGSHGGVIVSGSGKVSANNRPVAFVGDMYACPEHGTNPIVVGMPGILGPDSLIAYQGSQTACGAVITSGSPDVFVDVPKGFDVSSDVPICPINYVNKCRLCHKDVDGQPLLDKLYNTYFSGKGEAVVCDQNWERKLRKMIDDGEHDIDNLWCSLCRWYADHKKEWNPKQSFKSILDAMSGLFGRLYDDLGGKDQLRWTLVKRTLGNIRFGGRGELDYPSFDKVQHFLRGAGLGSKYAANVAGTAVEFKDALTRLYKEYISHNRLKHHVGYDMHDMEWTWAGGGFASAVYSHSPQGIDKILSKFANDDLVFSSIYTSIMPNKDPDAKYRNNSNIDHAEGNFPSPIEYPVKAMLIDIQIKRMEAKIDESAR